MAPAQATDDWKSLPTLDARGMPRVLARLAGLAWRHPGRCLAALGCALLSAVLGLVTPGLLAAAVDRAHGLLSAGGAGQEQAVSALWFIALLTVAAGLGRGIATGLQGYFGEYVAQRVGLDLRLEFFRKLQGLGAAYHDGMHSGELITRGMLDLEGVRTFLESGLLRLVVLLLLVGVGSWRLLHVDAVTGALALSFVPFVVWRATRMGARLRVSWVRLQQLMGRITRTMEENLQGVRVVRAFAGTDFEMAKFDQASEAALLLSNRRITLRTGSVTIMNLAYYSAMAAVLLIGGQRVAAGLLSVGGLTEILAFMTILQQPVRQVGMVVNSSARAASSGARLFEVLDQRPDIVERPDAPDLKVGEGVLRFENVGFAYPGGATAAVTLKNISFAVRRGRSLGIVGPPGSGKSTIAKLIPRFYDVDSGRITIDEQDIRDVSLSSLRRAALVVQQDVFLFDISIADNIAYADPEAGREAIGEAAETAQFHDFVATLPEGYDSSVGERGVGLSGGQRQRVAIARGLLARPSVMVLDDSTAAIDAVTERRLSAALDQALENAATIIIAHRLASLRRADEIIVLDEGGIVERGSHEGLLALDGRYAALWRLQNETAPLALETAI
ncbi:ABC transporter ATP-binding protein [Niveispirillum sp. KHB5.9]|uniref:ABC transporter ATP-binding protein n=1 Tax=Niveispirillum sp. KHB5.9 TaxID=3400269 RepID=UPI003A865365